MSNDALYDAKPWRQHYSKDIELQHHHTNLVDLIEAASSLYSRQMAFTTCMPNGMNGRLSFEQVRIKSDAFAVYLREVLQLSQGCRVAVQLPNCLSLPVVVFGILKAGCILVNMNPLYTAREMEHQLNDCDAEAIIILDMFTDKLEEIRPNIAVKHVVITSVAQWFPALPKLVLELILKYWSRLIPTHTLAFETLESAISQGQQLQNANQIDPQKYWQSLQRSDTAMLQYTGGTTGVSKGAELTHGNILSNLEQVDAMIGMHIEDGKECILTALPLYHIFAFTINLVCFYYKGAHNILVPSPRPVQKLQRAFDTYPISWMTGVNTLYNALLNEEWFQSYPPKTMKIALAGGTALHHAVAERWEKMVRCPILEGYGLTETSPVVCFNPPGLSKPGSIGLPVPDTWVRIVDENGFSVPQGEPGELIVKGLQVMKRYWNLPQVSQEALKDEWFLTGDIAIMDEAGYFHIVDRKKDMILVSGFNVYPNEVEDVIAMIDQVQESAVVGIPDATTGEAVCACIVLRENGFSKDDVIAHCKKELTGYKVPKKIVFMDELPKTPVGKVLRKDVKKMLENSLS